ncbi:uncharacterized protein LOC120075082 [Benincasa hispida]|uniref:uncharacterized protein LOC120075082 n=1 Tax=Benincasa hispida TaxID=102211 RepID=UPI001900FE63|nr:uncharacterized protein LOC120075082 [Benincasa hispida]
MENTGRASSCLAISEKKTHKPGGCVGIFFQLFDWNRRLAKKKLFSRKLLPPARAQQVTKKFKGGEKMPASKNHLIADENRGGFPNVKKNGNHCTDIGHKNEMRVPGLVARLMGLEAMPVINRDRPRKTGFSNPCDNAEKNIVEDMNFEKVSVKIEARPLKLQKTGMEEGKVMRRIGAEVLQYKSVMSRSRKHPSPPKLPSSTKSPRLPSGRNVSRASRLIDVASKILEPSLQISNRAKSAITLPKSMHHSPNEVISREMKVLPEEGYGLSKSTGQASCKNCNNLLKVEVFNHGVEEYKSAIPPLNSTYGNTSLKGSGWSKTTISESLLQQERDEILQTNCDVPKTVASKQNESKGCIISNVDSIAERMPLNKHNESRGCIISHVDSIAERMPLNNDSVCPSSRPSSQQFKPRTNESSMVKHCSQSEDHMTSVRDRMSSKSKASITSSRRTTSLANAVGGTKNFVALNRSLNGCSRGKLPAKVENSKFGLERKSGCEDFSSQSSTSPKKRRTAHVSGQIERKASVDSPAPKQRSHPCDKLSRTSSRLESKPLPTKQPRAGNRLAGRRDAAERVCKRDNDIVSFTFNSPVRQETRVATETNEEGMSNERNVSSQKPSLFGGDALDILEQKLIELTSQGDDESASPLKKPASVIIQELIAAIAAARKVSLEGSTVNMDVTYCDDSREEKITNISKGRDQLSPGSVLEASFSSSSMDESSGCRIPAESVDCSIDRPQLSESDSDLLDSATSLSEGNAGSERLTEVFNAIASILQSYNFTGIKLTGSKLARAKEVMLNTEILFGRDENNLIILPLFIDELETFTCEMWTNSSEISSLEDSKEVNHLRGFLFDCLIECLDSKHSQLYYGGSNALIRTLPRQNARSLIRDVEKEIKKWVNFVGMLTDEIVEWEMSHSLGKWSDFSIEELESGAEIDGYILQVLVEEIVTELWDCRKG